MTYPGSDCGRALGGGYVDNWDAFKAQAQAYHKMKEKEMEPKQVEEIMDRALDRYHNKHWYEEPRPSRLPYILAAAYLVAGFATFAYIQNHADIASDSDRTAGSILGIPFWPVYWAGQGALVLDRALTGWLSSPKQPQLLSSTAKTPGACTDDKTVWAPDDRGVCHYPDPHVSGGTSGFHIETNACNMDILSGTIKCN